MDSKLTITLYVMSWGGYWDKYKDQWIQQVNNFITQPDEIIIVSDVKVDASDLKHSNVKNIITPVDKNFYSLGNYRNVAIANSSSDWIVASDLDDEQLPNYLDNLDPSADICAFSFIDKEYDVFYTPNSESLNKRLLGICDNSMIPSFSAIKRSVFDKIRYEDSGHDDRVFYATASKLDLKVINVNPTEPRVIYSGFHPTPHNAEFKRVSDIYSKILSGNRNIYCFWFSELNEDVLNTFQVLQKHSGCNLVLINDKVFNKLENQEFPIHSKFKLLSDTQKIIYAKAYMMYFYGEGATDIEPNTFDWNIYFDELFLSRHDAVISKHYVFKPKTKVAHTWLSLIHEAMDKPIDSIELKDCLHQAQHKLNIDDIS